MDKRIRRNEYCIIGQPRCDFAFSSTRMCFIAYGYGESTLEMTILKKLLEERDIQPIEAGGNILPAVNAFCGKICSKIITSQFCIILINNDKEKNKEMPNANVNMEYGLMLGFNKYVIPFQRDSQKLPFNVAGLDTIKYSSNNFEQKAILAIDQAIKETSQKSMEAVNPDQILNLFLLAKKTLMSEITSVGEKAMYNLGRYLGFNLLHDFGGMNYKYLGNFTSFRPEVILFRLKILQEVLDGRRASIPQKVDIGVVTNAQGELAENIFKTAEVWVITNSEIDKQHLNEALESIPNSYKITVYSLDDVHREIQSLK